MKKMIALLTILFSTQIVHAQSKCVQKSIVGVWTENQGVFSAMFANQQAYKFNENGTVEIQVFDPEKHEFSAFANGKYKLDNQDKPSTITFSSLNISVFQTEVDVTVKNVNLSETLLEWEGILGINMELSRVYEHDKVNYTVSNISPISQVNYQTCWAACAAMLYSWRKKKVHPPYTIYEALTEIEKYTPQAERKFLKIWENSTDEDKEKGVAAKGGLNVSDAEELYYRRMHLTGFDMLHSNNCFKEKLEKSPVLMWRWNSNGIRENLDVYCPNYSGKHVMIMVGVVGDGTPEGTDFWVIDPWDWNEEEKKTPESIALARKKTFEELFECGYTWTFAHYSN